MSDYRETMRRWESTALTVEDIASLPDDELDDWQWAYYATRMFEWEVMNGGLHQYFFNNPDPELLELVLDGYRVLGLDDQAIVVREVVAPLAAQEAAWTSARDGTIETFMAAYVESALPEFDHRIEAHDADRLRFVRAEPQSFAI